MERYDVLVLGGGVLGCFAARHLTRWGFHTALLEGREDLCTGTTRANTAIVYTGCDTPPGTLKTRLCVEANRTFDDLCAQLGVPFARPGSLMVSCGPRAQRVLERKLRQGQENGVPGLRLLSGAEARAMELGLTEEVTGALYAPGTGTVNPWELGLAAWENAAANGCSIFLNAQVTALFSDGPDWGAETARGTFRARAVVNCCGLYADRVQELVSEPSVRIFPGKAEYLVLDDTVDHAPRHILFHEPEEKGKGLTVVPTVEGKLLLGPSEGPGEDKEDWSTTARGLDFLRTWTARVLPGLDLTKTIRSFGAIRPNPFYVHQEGETWVREEKSIHNFTIQNPRPRFWSFLGIKTPGLTCADGLGRYVAGLVAEELGRKEPNPAFDPVRTPPVRVKELSFEDRAALIRQNPAYGKILCRCGEITEGEVLDAIARGATTLDGVKRRAGTGLGRCQGSVCAGKVMDLLARELKVPVDDLRRDGPGTNWLGGNDRGTL